MKFYISIKKLSWVRWLALLGAFVFAFGVANPNATAAGDAHEESIQLCNTLKSQMGFLQGQKIYFRPGEKRNELFVYGVTELKEQQKLLDLVKREILQHRTRPVRIAFYPSERWDVQTTETKTTKSRKTQKPLRTETVD